MPLRRNDFSVPYLVSGANRLVEYKEIHEVLYKAVVALNDFQAGSLPLRDLLNGSRPKSLSDFIVRDIYLDLKLLLTDIYESF